MDQLYCLRKFKQLLPGYDPVEATLHAEHQFDLYKAWLSPSKLKFNECKTHRLSCTFTDPPTSWLCFGSKAAMRPSHQSNNI